MRLNLETPTKVLSWAVSTIALMTTSLLAILFSPLPEFQKGFAMGALLLTYLWLPVLIFHEYCREDAAKDNSNRTETMPCFDCIVKRLVEENLEPGVVDIAG